MAAVNASLGVALSSRLQLTLTLRGLSGAELFCTASVREIPPGSSPVLIDAACNWPQLRLDRGMGLLWLEFCAIAVPAVSLEAIDTFLQQAEAAHRGQVLVVAPTTAEVARAH